MNVAGLNLDRIPLFTISRNALTNDAALRDASQVENGAVNSEHLYGIFRDRLLEQLDSFPVLIEFLELIGQGSDSDYYIFGGTLRRTLMSSEAKCDLDVMVRNHDERVFRALADHKVPYSLNRRKHRRYYWNGFQFDINQPREWCREFEDIPDALKYFDLHINSLAYHARTRTVIDPYCMVTSSSYCDPGINWQRWLSMQPLDLAILAIRLERILRECPQLHLNQEDAALLLDYVVPVFDLVDWRTVADRYEHGKDTFVACFKKMIINKAR